MRRYVKYRVRCPTPGALAFNLCSFACPVVQHTDRLLQHQESRTHLFSLRPPALLLRPRGPTYLEIQPLFCGSRSPGFCSAPACVPQSQEEVHGLTPPCSPRSQRGKSAAQTGAGNPLWNDGGEGDGQGPAGHAATSCARWCWGLG